MTRSLRWTPIAVLVAGGVLALAGGLARAEDEGKDPLDEVPGAARLRLEVDPHGLRKELARVDSFARAGKNEDAVAIVDRLLRDPRTKDGFQLAKGGSITQRILTSFERALRARILGYPDETRKAFDLRFDDDARHLEEQGRADETALAKLVVRYPFSSRAPRAALELAERELESGRPDAAAAWLRTIVDEHGERVGPELLARVRLELAGALAVAGREGEAERVLDVLSGEPLARAKAVLDAARKARDANRPAVPAQPLPGIAWSHEVRDFYELTDRSGAAPLCEPLADGVRLYVQDGSHALALSLETGKVAWRASLKVRDDGYHETKAPCRLALGPTLVACAMPPSTSMRDPALVSIDRATGDVLFRLGVDDLRKMARIEDEAVLVPSLAVAGDVIVVPIEARHADDELTLLGIEGRTGALLWKCFVVSETADPSAAAPLVAEGPGAVYVLSNRGVVAAIEPQTGGIVWLRRYPSLRDGSAPLGPGIRPMPRPVRPRPAGEAGPPVLQTRPGWIGHEHGRLLVAPADAPRLFVLDPRTGELAWEVDDKGAPVIAPWRSGLLELQKDGTLVHVYKEVEPKAKTDAPGLKGVPALAGDALFLPLEGGIARVDVAERGDSRISLVVEWTALSGRPANLACSRGALIAVSEAHTAALAAAPPEAATVASDARIACRLLADPRWPVREAAFAKLVALGEGARSDLEVTTHSADPEARIRAGDALEEIARVERRAGWAPRVKPEWLKEKPGLLDNLTHRSADVRLDAVTDLGTLKDDDVVSLLNDLLHDTDERVRGRAGIGLLERGDRTGIGLIAKMVESPEVQDRKAALAALGKKGGAEDLPIFAKGADDEDPEVRALAASGAIGRCGEAAVPLAMRLAADPVERVRSDLCAALIDVKIAASLVAPLFAKLAKDPLRGIRELALRQLGTVGMRHQKDAIEAFAAGLLDQEPAVARIARERVVALDPEDIPKLPCAAIEKVFDDPQLQEGDRFHFVQIAETIVESAAPFAAAPLAKTALEAKNPRLRERALKVLYLRSRLKEPFTAADVMAVGSLAIAKEVPGAETAEERAKEAEEVRFDAYQTLARAHGPGTATVLLRGLEEPNEQIREFVVKELKTVVEPGVLVEMLRREACSTKPEEQAAVAAALDWKPDEKREVLAPVLLEGLSDTDARVRARAWKRVRDLAQQDEDLGFFEPDGKPEERIGAVRRAALWWWRRLASRDPGAFVKELAANNPSLRWKAAKKLADLGQPCFRSLVKPELVDAIAKAAADEKEEFVVRQELAVVAAVTGKPCSVKEGATADERARAVKIALDWRK